MAIINGTSGNDNLIGTSANDALFGLAGNDVLTGATAMISWTAGQDRTTFSGAVSEYLLGTQGGVLTVTDQNLASGNEGMDRLAGIDQLQFSDATLTVPTRKYLVSDTASSWLFDSPATALVDGSFIVIWTSDAMLNQDASLSGIYLAVDVLARPVTGFVNRRAC